MADTSKRFNVGGGSPWSPQEAVRSLMDKFYELAQMMGRFGQNLHNMENVLTRLQTTMGRLGAVAAIGLAAVGKFPLRMMSGNLHHAVHNAIGGHGGGVGSIGDLSTGATGGGGGGKRGYNPNWDKETIDKQNAVFANKMKNARAWDAYLASRGNKILEGAGTSTEETIIHQYGGDRAKAIKGTQQELEKKTALLQEARKTNPKHPDTAKLDRLVQNLSESLKGLKAGADKITASDAMDALYGKGMGGGEAAWTSAAHHVMKHKATPVLTTERMWEGLGFGKPFLPPIAGTPNGPSTAGIPFGPSGGHTLSTIPTAGVPATPGAPGIPFTPGVAGTASVKYKPKAIPVVLETPEKVSLATRIGSAVRRAFGGGPPPTDSGSPPGGGEEEGKGKRSFAKTAMFVAGRVAGGALAAGTAAHYAMSAASPDMSHTLDMSFQLLAGTIGSALIPAFAKLALSAQQFSGWLQAHPKVLDAIGSGPGGAAKALGGVGDIFSGDFKKGGGGILSGVHDILPGSIISKLIHGDKPDKAAGAEALLMTIRSQRAQPRYSSVEEAYKNTQIAAISQDPLEAKLQRLVTDNLMKLLEGQSKANDLQEETKEVIDRRFGQ